MIATMPRERVRLVPMVYGQWVRQRRIELGLTQQELADRLGWFDQARVSRVERNINRTFPSPEDLRLMATALETTPEAIMLALGYVDHPMGDALDDASYFTMMTEATRASDLPDALKANIMDTLEFARRQRRRMQEGK